MEVEMESRLIWYGRQDTYGIACVLVGSCSDSSIFHFAEKLLRETTTITCTCSISYVSHHKWGVCNTKSLGWIWQCRFLIGQEISLKIHYCVIWGADVLISLMCLARGLVNKASSLDGSPWSRSSSEPLLMTLPFLYLFVCPLKSCMSVYVVGVYMSSKIA